MEERHLIATVTEHMWQEQLPGQHLALHHKHHLLPSKLLIAADPDQYQV
jgi:hypothetical protein